MERIRFEYEVFTIVRLTREELAKLSDVCAHHYDGAVKGLTSPGAGAILNAARNTIGEDNEVEMKASTRQLDLLAKATEMIVAGDEVHFPLHMKFHELLRQAGDEWRRQNPEIAR